MAQASKDKFVNFCHPFILPLIIKTKMFFFQDNSKYLYFDHNHIFKLWYVMVCKLWIRVIFQSHSLYKYHFQLNLNLTNNQLGL